MRPFRALPRTLLLAVALGVMATAAPAAANAAVGVSLSSLNSEYTFSETGEVWMDLEVSNGGADLAEPTTIHVTLPDDLAFVAADSSAQCTGADQAVTCTTTAPLLAGGSASFNIVAAMLRPGGGLAVASLDPAVSCSWAEQNDGCDFAGFSLYGFSDLQTTLTVEGPQPLRVGSRGELVLTTTNDGHVVTVDATIFVPRGLRIESVPAGCIDYGGSVECVVADIADGGVATRRLPFLVTPDAASRTLVADFYAYSEHIDMVDNNGGPLSFDVPAAADLGLNADVQLALSATAGMATYALRVVNSGPSTATDAAVTAALPSGISFVGGEGCTVAGSGVRCTFAPIASGDAATRTFTANVPLTDTARSLVTRFAVASSIGDPLASNDVAVATVSVGALGVDRPTVAGPAVVEPTVGPDTLIATTGGSRLAGGRGNDVLIGLLGNDLLRGGPGADRLFGGPGNDRLFGGAGADRAYGDAGADVLDGGPGPDTLSGGAGNDVVRGGAGDDPFLWGGAGNDRLLGGTGRDRLVGGPGNDLIDARDGRGGDVVDCGPGRDAVRADRGDRIAASCELRR